MSSYELIWRLVILLLLSNDNDETQEKKQRIIFVAGTATLLFLFLLKIKKEIYLRNISRAISCLQTNLLANVIITSIILYVKRFKKIHSLQINSSILLLFYSFYVIY